MLLKNYFPVLLLTEICLITDGCLRVILQYDSGHRLIITSGTWKKTFPRKEIFWYSAAMSIFISIGMPGWGIPEKIGAGVLGAYLLTASLIDVQTCEVYDFLHYIGAGAGILLCLTRSTDRTLYLSLFIFWILQHFLFARMYGMADARTFVVCALFVGAAGGRLQTYLYHMSAAFLTLGAVQAVRQNINRQGNLKQPVPFLPYISLTVWIFLDFSC